MSRWQRGVYLLGVSLILFAIGQSTMKVLGGGAPFEAAIDFLLIGFAGALVLVVGSWLPEADLPPELYPRIIGWCLGGVGVMLTLLALRAVHPGVTTSFSYGTRALSITIGSIAGLGIGIHEARAIARERTLVERNDELRRTQERLERANGELTRVQGELEDTVRRLEASNERLDQFASTAAHDVQEPLRMVSQYLGLLEKRYGDELDEDATEYLEFAVDGADRMQTLVNDLLDYARVEGNGVSFERVDLNDVLADVRTDLKVRIAESNAEITAEELPHVEGDAGQLRQLFQNLLQNAIEYSGDEPPRIRVGAERAGDEWRVTVRDEGIGIDADAQEQIFELFERLDAGSDHSGSGIGLALCHRIAEHHGGEIEVESEPGRGSAFSVTVLAAEQVEERPETVSTD
ncbi:ATP-binding protein [Natronoarchaeum mannanilyticum]|uniref:histidine kinase n=1 Tax=Natronoarchaeum mannanilyticum TaxID=926360 RepID=A0AAV3TCN2_9EURY